MGGPEADAAWSKRRKHLTCCLWLSKGLGLALAVTNPVFAFENPNMGVFHHMSVTSFLHTTHVFTFCGPNPNQPSTSTSGKSSPLAQVLQKCCKALLLPVIRAYCHCQPSTRPQHPEDPPQSQHAVSFTTAALSRLSTLQQALILGVRARFLNLNLEPQHLFSF